MRIVSAAIKANGLILSRPAPARHCDIIKRMPVRMARAVLPSDQGFLTDTGMFLDRVEGLRIARANGQLLMATPLEELFSEDLW